MYFLIEIEICNNLMTNQLWFWKLSVIVKKGANLRMLWCFLSAHVL